MRKLLLSLVICLFFLPATVSSTPLSGPAVFVTSYTGEQVLRIDGTTGAVTVVFTFASGLRPEDIAVGPDNLLYICLPENNKIVRMTQTGTNVETIYYRGSNASLPAAPQGPRFSFTGDLFFNSGGTTPLGVWKIAGVASIPYLGSIPAPVNILAAAQTGTGKGEGLWTQVNGDLLVVNRTAGTLFRSTFPALNTASSINTSLGDPRGITRNSVGEIFIAQGGSYNNILKCDINGQNCSTYATFAGQRPFYLEAALDDTIFVATSDLYLKNGKVWRIPPPPPLTTPIPVLVASLPKRNYVYPPAIGLALEPTSRSIEKTFTGTKAFQFGSHFFEVLAGTCTATITATQTPPSEVAALIAAIQNPPNPFDGALDQPYLGEGGFDIVYNVTISPAGCNPGPGGTFGYRISAFLDNAFSKNPRIIRCDGEPVGCFITDTTGYYPVSPTLGIPGDPVIGSKGNNFSKFFLADIKVPAAVAGTFCGFLPPIKPNGTSVFSSGQTVPVKFQLGKNGCGKNLITNATAIISVARISPSFQIMEIDAAGHGKNPPVFDVTGKQYHFNLKLTNYPPGTYILTVVFLTNNAPAQSVFFTVAP